MKVCSWWMLMCDQKWVQQLSDDDDECDVSAPSSVPTLKLQPDVSCVTTSLHLRNHYDQNKRKHWRFYSSLSHFTGVCPFSATLHLFYLITSCFSDYLLQSEPNEWMFDLSHYINNHIKVTFMLSSCKIRHFKTFTQVQYHWETFTFTKAIF